MKKIFTFLLTLAFVILFGFSLNTVSASGRLTINENDTVTLTESNEYDMLDVIGNLIISNNATIEAKRVRIYNTGSITIEEGATLKLTKDDFFCSGKIDIKGFLIGNCSEFNYDSKITLHDTGVIYFIGDDHSYFSYAVYLLKKEGYDANTDGNYFCAFGKSHVHNYDDNGVCTNCLVPGCVIGYMSHNKVDNACLRCGLKGPETFISRDQTSSTLYVDGHCIIKSGATVTVNNLEIRNGCILTIEDGATIIINNGNLMIQGKLILNGCLKGSSKYFSISGNVVASEDCIIDLEFSDEYFANNAHFIFLNAGINAKTQNNKLIYTSPNHVHTFENYICTKCGAIDQYHPHTYVMGKCTICDYGCPHDYNQNRVCRMCGACYCDLHGGHRFVDGKCSECGYKCNNPFHNNKYSCPDCNMTFDPKVAGSIISKGSVTIIVGLVLSAAFFTIGLFIGKSKKTKTEEE